MSTSFLSYGMVGGGPGSFIGVVHKAALAINGNTRLAAGCFSRDAAKNQLAGTQNNIDPDRVYPDYDTMAEQESNRQNKIDFIVIVTQNVDHFKACKAFLSRGINVMCEKPLTIRLDEAKELKRLAKANNCLLGVGYAYSGHVMAKEARWLVQSGAIGKILCVMGEYPQDWLMGLVTEREHGISSWRIDPLQAGYSNCIGDIGTHIEHTVSYMTDLKIKKLCAVMDKFGENTTLDNNAQVLLKFENGASGVYWCSQVAIGNDNGLKVRIYGTEGAIEFDQEDCNYLRVTKRGQAPMRYSRGCGYISDQAAAFSRVPSGHPEGYHTAFANMYAEFTRAVTDKLDGKPIREEDYDYPNATDGVNGIRFIEKCLQSAENSSAWVEMED